MQVVITPAQPYMSWTNEAIAAEADKQVRQQTPMLRSECGADSCSCQLLRSIA